MAKRRPNDPKAHRRLAEAEFFLPGGESKHVERALRIANRSKEKDAGRSFLMGLELAVHGDPGRAAPYFLEAAELSGTEPESRWNYLLGEVALASLADVYDVVPNFAKRFQSRLAKLSRSSTAIGPTARSWAYRLRSEVALRRGDRKDALQAMEEQHCPRSWRVAGPFGPWKLLGFDQKIPAEHDRSLKESYDLRGGRGVAKLRQASSQDCSFRLGEGNTHQGGVFVARGNVKVERGGDYLLRIDANDALRLYVGPDGRELRAKPLVRDTRKRSYPRTTFHPIKVEGGALSYRLVLASRQSSPEVRLSLLPAPPSFK